MTSERQARLDAEAHEIRQAAQRLLSGTALRTGGTVSIAGLAAEAGLSRQRLYEHHAELVAEFKTTVTGGPTPPNIQALQQQLADARARNTELERANATLQERIRTLSLVVAELTHEAEGTNVVAMPRARATTRAHR